MKMVYIASPFKGDYEKNTQNAIDYCAKASEKGVLPLAPHIIFSNWCHDTDPELRQKGLQLGLELLKKCDEVWVCGKHISEGMRGEIELAKELGIPLFHVREPTNIDEYPVSSDGNSLLSDFDTLDNSKMANYESLVVICSHTKLKEEYRTAVNQLWIVTHGPGCSANYARSDTVHLTHPVDNDRIVVGRADILGVAKPEVSSKLLEAYRNTSVLDKGKDEDMSL